MHWCKHPYRSTPLQSPTYTTITIATKLESQPIIPLPRLLPNQTTVANATIAISIESQFLSLVWRDAKSSPHMSVLGHERGFNPPSH